MVAGKREKTTQSGIYRYQTRNGTRYEVVAPGLTDPVTGTKGTQRTKGGLLTMKAAKEQRAAFWAEAEHAAGTGGRDWTVAELAGRWLLDLERTGKVKPTSVMKYERRLERHILPGIGKLRVREVTVLRLQALFDAKRTEMGANSLLSLHLPIRAMFRRAVLWGIIPFNPADGVSLPVRPSSPGKAWSVQDLKRFLSETRADPHGVIGRLLLLTGMRIGELVTLRWTDLDLDRATMRIERTLTRSRANKRVAGQSPKTGAGARELLLTAGCVAALKRHRAAVDARAEADPAWSDEGWVFPGRHGTCWNEQTPRCWLDRQTARLGLDRLRLHDTRHTHATIGRRLGVDRAIMAQRLGHRIPGATAGYEHLTAEAQRPLVEAFEVAIGERTDPKLTRRPQRRKRGRANGPKRCGKSGSRPHRRRIVDHAHHSSDGER